MNWETSSDWDQYYDIESNEIIETPNRINRIFALILRVSWLSNLINFIKNPINNKYLKIIF